MNDKIENLLKQPWTIPTVIGVLSFGGGLGLGYFLGKRRTWEVNEVHELPKQLNWDFDSNDPIEPVRPAKVIINEEVALAKDIVTVNSLAELRPSMLSQEEVDLEEIEEDDDVVPVILETVDEVEWDYEKELPNRTSSMPYVLHQEEFYADELNYTQTTLTYYAIDDIMTDEDDKPVYNYSNVTGPLTFGHGSGDSNVVYIRNDQLRAEYEVVKLDALYSVEVLGLEIENNERVASLKHSKITKFRMD